MKKASDLRKSLADVLPADEIDQIIASAIGRGEIEDDENSGTLTPDIVKSLVGEMRESLYSVETETETIAKSSIPDATIESDIDDPEFIDVEATLNSVVNSANAMNKMVKSLVRQTGTTDGHLAKGVMALGQLTEHMLGQQAALAKSQAEIAERLDAVAKALRIPVQPRAVTGMAQKIPHPGEVAKSATGAVVPVESAAVDADALAAKCLSEQQRLSGNADSDSIYKSQQMAAAISQLSTGVPVAEVVKNLPHVAALAAA